MDGRSESANTEARSGVGGDTDDSFRNSRHICVEIAGRLRPEKRDFHSAEVSFGRFGERTRGQGSRSRYRHQMGMSDPSVPMLGLDVFGGLTRSMDVERRSLHECKQQSGANHAGQDGTHEALL